MLTADDIKLLQNALAAYEDDNRVDAGTATQLLGKLTVMLPVPPAPTLRCTRCGRQQGEPAERHLRHSPLAVRMSVYPYKYF